MTGAVRAADRRRDVGAMVMLLIGAALMLYANFGMHNLSLGQITLAEGEWQMNRYNTYSRMSSLGGAFVVAGALVGVWSMTRYLFYRRAARNAEKDSP